MSCITNYTPTNYYETVRNTMFLESPEAEDRVRKMAIFRWRRENPGRQIIIHPTDVKDAMYYVTSRIFTQTENVHNMSISAANRLFDMMTSNLFEVEELGDHFEEVKRRVHEVTNNPRIRSTHLKQKFVYTLSNNIS